MLAGALFPLLISSPSISVPFVEVSVGQQSRELGALIM